MCRWSCPIVKMMWVQVSEDNMYRWLQLVVASSRLYLDDVTWPLLLMGWA